MSCETGSDSKLSVVGSDNSNTLLDCIGRGFGELFKPSGIFDVLLHCLKKKKIITVR